jgi:hypothetical protein
MAENSIRIEEVFVAGQNQEERISLHG